VLCSYYLPESATPYAARASARIINIIGDPANPRERGAT
jgi:hypothetical protein